MVTETAAFVQREVYGQGQIHMAMCSIWAPRNMTRIVNNSMGCGGGAMHDGAMGLGLSDELGLAKLASSIAMMDAFISSLALACTVQLQGGFWITEGRVA